MSSAFVFEGLKMHLKARGMIVALPHAKAGAVKMMGVPIRLHGTPGRATSAAPVLGADTERVLTRVLGDVS